MFENVSTHYALHPHMLFALKTLRPVSNHCKIETEKCIASQMYATNTYEMYNSFTCLFSKKTVL